MLTLSSILLRYAENPQMGRVDLHVIGVYEVRELPWATLVTPQVNWRLPRISNNRAHKCRDGPVHIFKNCIGCASGPPNSSCTEDRRKTTRYLAPPTSPHHRNNNLMVLKFKTFPEKSCLKASTCPIHSTLAADPTAQTRRVTTTTRRAEEAVSLRARFSRYRLTKN